MCLSSPSNRTSCSKRSGYSLARDMRGLARSSCLEETHGWALNRVVYLVNGCVA